ncbi:hypothetical protein C2G38_2224720 [Gigaspora rosea]|uniref:Protein kinase domain-containing protein n=1 Tax=Gigaspora rosea TaxID=44941 RepID=A0A397U8C7_9GLOM|nr:hypothetical protein C2G38_2224720 [Gigaspora rosea]
MILKRIVKKIAYTVPTTSPRIAGHCIFISLRVVLNNDDKNSTAVNTVENVQKRDGSSHNEAGTFQVPLKKKKKGHNLSMGGYDSRADSNVLAAKRLFKNVINLIMLYSVEKEIYSFKRCLAPCDRIIGLFGVTMKDNIPCLLIEWAQDGNLYQYMKTYKTVEKKKMSWQFKTLDIAKAVIIHLDIRSHNSKLDFKYDIYSMAILLWKSADGRETLPHAHIPDRLLKNMWLTRKARWIYDDDEYQPECVVFNKLVRKMWTSQT